MHTVSRGDLEADKYKVREPLVEDYSIYSVIKRLFIAAILTVPGRVNLIGEHIDYHNLPVLPIAIQKQITLSFLPRTDRRIHATSEAAPDAVVFSLDSPFVSEHPGHWGNYIRAAAQSIQTRYQVRYGINAHVTSDLPPAAGLSSSSALLIAFSLALLRANHLQTSLEELTQILPDGEQLVGTRGGAMDHVAILGSRAGFATFIASFHPLSIHYFAIPANWRFLIAHSLLTAEKSSAVRAEFNQRRHAATRALEKLGLKSYRDAIISQALAIEDETERQAFRHVVYEHRRVLDATEALHLSDLNAFGRLLHESHLSLRDNLRVSLPAVDELVEYALQAGAYGARLTGAGFGGCVVCLCTDENVEKVRTGLTETYYAGRTDFHPAKHLFIAEPSAGALTPQSPDHSH